MVLARVQHIYRHKSGLAEDDIVNTWYFRSNTEVIGDGADLIMIVNDFYNQQVTATNTSVVQHIATTLMQTARERYKIYDMDHESPRSPVVDTTPGTPNPANGTAVALPGEVAVCLSYRAALLSGTSAARRRGRMYLGPLNTTASSVEATLLNARPNLPMRQAIIACADRMAALALTNGWTWVVYSPTVAADPGVNGGGEFAAQTITDVWCDDAFDVQRRRGVKPTSRVSVTL